MKRLFALGLVLLTGAGNPASAQDDALMRMVLLTQTYQAIAARCDTVTVDPAYSTSLNEMSDALRPYVSNEVWDGTQATLAGEGLDCSPESDWVQMFLRAQQQFVNTGGEITLMPQD